MTAPGPYVLHQSCNDEAPIVVTQNDIRQIQLAKAALYAGVKLLMDHIGTEGLSVFVWPGPLAVILMCSMPWCLGLIPDCVLEQVSSAGNAAGTGARIALLNQQSRNVIETLVKNIEKIETAMEPKFQDYFVDAMAFPNKTDPFPIYFLWLSGRPRWLPIASSGRKRRRR